MLDWKKWKSSEMSLLEFLLLKLVYESAQKPLPFNIAEEIELDLFIDLEKSGYVRTGFNKIYITAKGVDVFDTGNINFEQFFNMFPQKVPNGQGGHRILRAVDITARNAADAFRKWKMVTGSNSNKEEYIISCLKAELNSRQRNNDLQYMNNILAWLNGRKWEMYAHLVDEPKKENNSEKSI